MEHELAERETRRRERHRHESQLLPGELLYKTALLQDRFDGEGGVYVYDETPAAGQRAGFLARGLEGISDAFLKALRI